jgi:hypothetical protein
MGYFKTPSRNSAGETEEQIKRSQDSHCLGRDSNPAPPKYSEYLDCL